MLIAPWGGSNARISSPAGLNTLTIEPGVDVLFDANARFIVHGSLDPAPARGLPRSRPRPGKPPIGADGARSCGIGYGNLGERAVPHRDAFLVAGPHGARPGRTPPYPLPQCIAAAMPCIVSAKRR